MICFSSLHANAGEKEIDFKVVDIEVVAPISQKDFDISYKNANEIVKELSEYIVLNGYEYNDTVKELASFVIEKYNSDDIIKVKKKSS